VVLVTKAVGDFLGTNGIADEMIRFNGYPFLEKEDHAYNVSGKSLGMRHDKESEFRLVSAVMRKELHTLTESGMSVRDVGTIGLGWVEPICFLISRPFREDPRLH
jgi:chloride channel 3/4/5